VISLVSFLLIPLASNSVEASNPNLFVSAENPKFDNYFAGSMVVEVVINDINIRDTDEGKGEPDVTLNGKQLRMVQGSDGQWYAYFAHVDAAQNADQIVFNILGAEGESLDFGVFCDRNTDSLVLGVSFSDSDGVAVPRIGNLTGFTNGNSPLSSCSGIVDFSTNNINNVVRQSKSINTNSPAIGQIGLESAAWPIIQLFSFDNVVIKYNRGGGVQIAELEYDEIPNILLELDRTGYPNNAEVFVTINDIQLNQDPTDEDSWTFNIASPIAVFYQAFNENGVDAANGTPGLINLVPNLSSLDFEDNGILTMNLGSIAELLTNDNQPDSSVSNGVTFTQIVTLVESEPNSGIFENFDNSDQSTIGILGNAPRGQSATITYNDQSSSIVSGTFTASVSLGTSGIEFSAGQKTPISLVDPDQNINSGSKEDLDVFRSSAIIPTLQIGEPVTLEKTSGVKVYATSLVPLGGGTSVSSLVPDKNSDRLILDTGPIGITTFEKISMNLGITAGTLHSLFVDNSSPNNAGTNWLNFDLRSFEEQLDVTSFSDTSMILHFGGLPGATTVQILDPGDITSGKGFVPIDDADIATISSVSSSSSVFLEINFDASNNTPSAGTISNENDKQPIIFDLFSFGIKNNNDVNNAIYRFELEETADNSGTFSGTVEYTVTNQLTLFDTNKIQNTLRTIDDKIHFLVTNRLIDEEGISISYSDVEVGVTITKSSKTDIKTNSGIVSTNTKTYRFGQPVTIILNDSDLNIDHDTRDVYTVVNDPNSPNVDTVGTSSGEILLEVLIKDIRYKRCTINGVQHGGLASTGFSLTETGSSTGIFEGTFQIPTQICDKTGTKLITTAGGSLDAKYHDFRDSFGERNIFSLSSFGTTYPKGFPPTLNSEKFILPEYRKTTEVILTGKLDDYKSGTRLQLNLIGPDQSTENLNVYATSQGEYKVVMTLDHNSLTGIYTINAEYLNLPIGSVSFQVIQHIVPEWIKNNARWWSDDQISDSEFLKGIEYLIKEEVILIPDSLKSESAIQEIPDWIKNTANWWSDDIVTDDEFVSALEFLIKNGIIRI